MPSPRPNATFAEIFASNIKLRVGASHERVLFTRRRKSMRTRMSIGILVLVFSVSTVMLATQRGQGGGQARPIVIFESVLKSSLQIAVQRTGVFDARRQRNHSLFPPGVPVERHEASQPLHQQFRIARPRSIDFVARDLIFHCLNLSLSFCVMRPHA
jgi:hypothetical protein